jgi:gluconokinase
MGVSGSGKTAIGSRLAAALGVEFVEGDAYHPAANIRKMSSGIPLTDDDRHGWLRAIAQRIRRANDAGDGVVVSCSALKRAYRDLLRHEAGAVQFVFLRGTRDLIETRLRQRKGHFMPTSLLESQLATLENPSAEEGVWIADIDESPDRIVASLVARASA